MTLAAIATPGLTFEPEAHVYRLDGVELPSVTAVLKDNRLSGHAYARVAPWVLEQARQRGQAVHAATHYLDEGDLDEASVAPEIRPYVDAWQQFKIDRGVEVLALERRLADPLWKFAGTLDRILRVRGVVGEVVADIKTGDFAGAGYQTAAYALLADQLADIPRTSSVWHRWVVELHPDRGLGYSVHPFREVSDRGDFLAALRLTHLRARLGRPWFEAA